MNDKTENAPYVEPKTLEEWVALEAHLAGIVLDIDTQLGMHKSGAVARDALWHPKALAKRGHTIKQLMAVRETVKKMRKDAHRDEAAAAHKRREAQYLHQIEKARASARRAKDRAAALYDWVYDQYPDRREELSRLWRDCAQNEQSTNQE